MTVKMAVPVIDPNSSHTTQASSPVITSPPSLGLLNTTAQYVNSAHPGLSLK